MHANQGARYIILNLFISHELRYFKNVIQVCLPDIFVIYQKMLQKRPLFLGRFHLVKLDLIAQHTLGDA